MNPQKLRLGFCFIAVVFAAGCGSPGIPEPPSLEIARPVRDLTAVRKGDEVHLTWSVPTETTDHHAFRHAGPMLICRSVGSEMHECTTPITQLPPPAIAVPKEPSRRKGKSRSPESQVPQASYTDQLSASLEQQSPTENLVYAVSVLNSYGKSAGLSNRVQIPSAPTLPAPGNFTAHIEAQGVRLEWNAVTAPPETAGLRYEYRVYRRDVQSGKDSIAGEVQLTGSANVMLLDTSFEWEKTYQYRATVVTLIDQAGNTTQVEGDDTPAVQIFAHDVFPPATPTGLQAAFSGPGQKSFVDLVWTANTESDLAGYSVYRREAGEEPVKINSELVKTPAFRDSNVEPGHQYSYSVSAVDVRGNESPRSEEASDTVSPSK